MTDAADSGITSLTVTTPIGAMTLDSKALKTISSQASGSDITLSIQQVDKEALTSAQQEVVGDGSVVDLTVLSKGKIISDMGSGGATIIIPYKLKDGESAEGAAVWYLADDGSLTQINANYDKASGCTVFTLEHFSRYLIGYDPVAAWENPFADVAKTEWFYPNVYFVCTNGIFQGTNADTFAPRSEMNRAMLVTALWRLEGETMPSVISAFKDVKAGDWSSDAVSWASEEGVVEGLSGELFGTANRITREQIAVMLYRYGKLKGYSLAAGADLSKYTDRGSVAPWAVEAISWANAAGIINGRTPDTLAPGSSATRAEVAAMIQRFAETFSAEGASD